MSLWHVLLYVAAAIIALRSFIQLVTNYRSEYEQQLVEEELRRRAEEVEHARAEEQAEYSSLSEIEVGPHA